MLSGTLLGIYLDTLLATRCLVRLVLIVSVYLFIVVLELIFYFLKVVIWGSKPKLGNWFVFGSWEEAVGWSVSMLHYTLDCKLKEYLGRSTVHNQNMFFIKYIVGSFFDLIWHAQDAQKNHSSAPTFCHFVKSLHTTYYLLFTIPILFTGTIDLHITHIKKT